VVSLHPYLSKLGGQIEIERRGSAARPNFRSRDDYLRGRFVGLVSRQAAAQTVKYFPHRFVKPTFSHRFVKMGVMLTQSEDMVSE